MRSSITSQSASHTALVSYHAEENENHRHGDPGHLHGQGRGQRDNNGEGGERQVEQGCDEETQEAYAELEQRYAPHVDRHDGYCHTWLQRVSLFGQVRRLELANEQSSCELTSLSEHFELAQVSRQNESHPGCLLAD